MSLPGSGSHLSSDVDQAIDVAYAKAYGKGWRGSLHALGELVLERGTKRISIQQLLRDIEDVRKVVGNG